MVKIIKGTYGHRKGTVIVPVCAGETVELTEDQEARLVRLGVAEYVNNSAASSKDPQDDETNDETGGASALPEYNDKMKVPELKEIAAQYGVDASTMTTKKAIIEAIDAARNELPSVDGAGDVVD